MGNESVDSGLSAACAIAVLFVTPVCLVILNILQTFSLGAIVSPTIWAKGKISPFLSKKVLIWFILHLPWLYLLQYLRNRNSVNLRLSIIIVDFPACTSSVRTIGCSQNSNFIGQHIIATSYWIGNHLILRCSITLPPTYTQSHCKCQCWSTTSHGKRFSVLFLVIQLFKLYLTFSGLFSGLFFYFNLVSDENSSLNYPTFRIGWPTRVMLTTKLGSQTFCMINKVGCVFQIVRNSIVTHLLYSQ